MCNRDQGCLTGVRGLTGTRVFNWDDRHLTGTIDAYLGPGVLNRNQGLNRDPGCLPGSMQYFYHIKYESNGCDLLSRINHKQALLLK